MSRFAVNIKETASDTFLVEAENYEEAKEIIQKMYNDGKIGLSAVDYDCKETIFSDDTENYEQLFTEEELHSFPYVNPPEYCIHGVYYVED